MNRPLIRIVVSVLLIGFGVVILLANLGVLPFDIDSQSWFWALVFAAAGVGFLAVFLNDARENWWAVIPSFTFFGLAVVVGDFFPPPYEELSPGIFMGMIALSFWVIFIMMRDQWWAIIPAGVLTSVAAIIVVSGFNEESDLVPVVLFAGIALTFLGVYLRPVEGQRQTWALFPAGIMGALALLILVGMSDLTQLIVPAALIVVGLVIIFRAVLRPS
jgi:hypothetical protein